MAKSSIDEQVGGIARDLLKLEINTIIKRDMSATKMPPVRHALMDIGKSYRQELTRLQAGEWSNLESGNTPHGSLTFFNAYRAAASAKIKQMEATPPPTSEDELAQYLRSVAMLERIRDTSDQMKAILQRIGNDEHGNVEENNYTRNEVEGLTNAPRPQPLEPRLAPEHLMIIRKAWEIMTEQVLLQTVIQMDGDVITRMSPRVAELHDIALVFRIHKESVELSIEFWSKLIGLVTGFLKGLIPRFGSGG